MAGVAVVKKIVIILFGLQLWAMTAAVHHGCDARGCDTKRGAPKITVARSIAEP